MNNVLKLAISGMAIGLLAWTAIDVEEWNHYFHRQAVEIQSFQGEFGRSGASRHGGETVREINVRFRYSDGHGLRTCERYSLFMPKSTFNEGAQSQFLELQNDYHNGKQIRGFYSEIDPSVCWIYSYSETSLWRAFALMIAGGYICAMGFIFIKVVGRRDSWSW